MFIKDRQFVEVLLQKLELMQLEYQCVVLFTVYRVNSITLKMVKFVFYEANTKNSKRTFNECLVVYNLMTLFCLFGQKRYSIAKGP